MAGMIRRGELCRAPVVQSSLDFSGGALFLLAATSGAAMLGASLSHWLVDLAYLGGSLAFLLASVAGLWLWKGDQYGLSLVPEINFGENHDGEPAEYARHQEQLAQYGCGKSSARQIPWLMMYMVNASASVIDVALSLQPEQIQIEGVTHRIASSTLNFCLSHAIIALGSVVHHVPTVAPHNWLLRGMRVIFLCYTINSWFTVAQRISDL